ncbi:MAG: cyclodeaminase/cyclohydrolase family protein [Planctomycetota bacterium]|jgi:formiminotetrahydrofolate cyclodeaminase|nr:cyclodeaminase/cyclohydrolase family protein [Planctomycetota bacterium]
MPGGYANKTLAEFIDLAASGDPVPGGGGVAALAGALGAAMASMAANFTVGRPRYAEYDAEARQVVEALRPVIAGLRDAVDGDAEAFLSVSAAYRLPKSADDEKEARGKAIEAALLASLAVPEKALDLALEAALLLPRLAEYANANLLSDVEVAAIMLEAAARAARVNILVNAAQLAGKGRAAADGSREKLTRVGDLARAALAAVAKRRA